MKKIAILPIKGPIYEEKLASLPFSFPNPLTEVRRYIEKVEREDEIRGVVFEINSPGGTPYPCKEMARTIKNIDKPTVAWIRENGLSGAYWIASSCDEIVADELSRVGGVGVAGIRLDFSGFMEKLGIKFDTPTSGKYKGLGLPFKKPTSEEHDLVKEQLEAINKIFTKEVARNRNLTPEKVKELSKGKPYLGMQAKNLGLIDHFGGKEKAIEICKKLAEIEEAEIIDYSEEIREKEGEAQEKILGKIIKKLF